MKKVYLEGYTQEFKNGKLVKKEFKVEMPRPVESPLFKILRNKSSA